jgi:hypothetical protein
MAAPNSLYEEMALFSIGISSLLEQAVVSTAIAASITEIPSKARLPVAFAKSIKP